MPPPQYFSYQRTVFLATELKRGQNNRSILKSLFGCCKDTEIFKKNPRFTGRKIEASEFLTHLG